MSKARDQLLFDIFVTAMEGGINYWSMCGEYHWTNKDYSDDLQGFYASIVDTEDELQPFRIDRKTIARGYSLATSEWRDWISWSSGCKPPLVITSDTEWDYDAGDADVIVQLGLFGEVVYG